MGKIIQLIPRKKEFTEEMFDKWNLALVGATQFKATKEEIVLGIFNVLNTNQTLEELETIEPGIYLVGGDPFIQLIENEEL